MKIKAVLFDLDGTLLPQDQEEFIRTYFGLLAKKLAPFGYEPEKLIESVWLGTEAVIANTGERTNEAVFWDAFGACLGEDIKARMPLFEEFYENEFLGVKKVCGFDPRAAETVAAIKALGLRTALATNPIFPSVATENRIRWAGLEPEDFELYTTYENSSYAKPSAGYYMEVANGLGLDPEECLMVGNDVSDDMPAETLGMKVFLLTDCLINKEDKDISGYPRGSFPELMSYIGELCGAMDPGND